MGISGSQWRHRDKLGTLAPLPRPKSRGKPGPVMQRYYVGIIRNRGWIARPRLHGRRPTTLKLQIRALPFPDELAIRTSEVLRFAFHSETGLCSDRVPPSALRYESGCPHHAMCAVVWAPEGRWCSMPLGPLCPLIRDGFIRQPAHLECRVFPRITGSDTIRPDGRWLLECGDGFAGRYLVLLLYSHRARRIITASDPMKIRGRQANSDQCRSI